MGVSPILYLYDCRHTRIGMIMCLLVDWYVYSLHYNYYTTNLHFTTIDVYIHHTTIN